MDFKLPTKPEDLVWLAGPVIGVIVLLLALVGIGAGSSEGDTNPAPSTNVKPTTEQPTPSPTPTTEAQSGRFENNVLDSLDYRFEITKVEVVRAGGRENVLGSKPVIVFTYDFTNKRAREVDTIEAWVGTFSAKQEDENVRQDLQMAVFYTDDLADNKVVKPNGKVTAQFAYELKDADLPVTLSAQTGLILKSGAGKQVYPIK
ncbi:DUF5067 domain-containing protein [Corynebacterium sp. zg912]|uniref:DUF5067 domain-containing protein n=1 Tax=Corynebacterium wankanglinii TaxID=2735136 RepID=A0A7H0K9D7_9CORY|nr:MULTISPECIES: DUF5067 domain-containing protein [Corynebacterium]MBA1838057.1 DUF5067 domain-containing protein [Corynebacterium wankanglinii]MCR5929172.1 DUF5067 domain-containing protein [Corynebacterium sp. zg912]QNP93903.1 DUF5067 domain-containing protein [Corynebacterium wankanglinii]